MQRRHQYVTVISSQDRVLHVADDRKRVTLDAWYASQPAKALAGLRTIAMDMWGPFIDSTLAHVPGAEHKIAFDKFHVAQHLGDAVDKVRRSKHKALLVAEGGSVLTKSRYLWLQHPDNMTDKSWVRLKELKSANLKTARAWGAGWRIQHEKGHHRRGRTHIGRCQLSTTRNDRTARRRYDVGFRPPAARWFLDVQNPPRQHLQGPFPRTVSTGQEELDAKSEGENSVARESGAALLLLRGGSEDHVFASHDELFDRSEVAVAFRNRWCRHGLRVATFSLAAESPIMSAVCFSLPQGRSMSSNSHRNTILGIALAVVAIVQSSAFAQSAPPVNNIDCAVFSSTNIGQSILVTLDGTNVVSWDVIYNGTQTTYEGSASTVFVPPIVGDDQTVTIVANGFDGNDPVADQVDCDISYNPPACSSATQDPDTTVTPVDVGTVIALSLDTTNAVSTTIDTIPMTPAVDPNTNFGATWAGTTTAISNTVITAVSTNPEGESTQCTWDIQVNDSPPPPTITQPPDGSTVLIEGFVNEEFVAEWTESADPDGDPVTYLWELAADPGFSTMLLQIPSLTDTRVVLTLADVEQLLSSNGVNVGDSITLFHRATASDDFSASEGPAAEVTLTLGNVFDRLPTQPVPTLGLVALSVMALFMLALAFFKRRKTG